MHGGSRLPSRGGQRRGLPGPAYGAISRQPLFTPPPSPPPATSAVRLPSLTASRSPRTPAAQTSFTAKEEAAAQAARLRYTSSLKRTTRPPVTKGGDAATPSTTETSANAPVKLPPSFSSSLTPPPLESAEPPTAAFSSSSASCPPLSHPPPPAPLSSSSSSPSSNSSIENLLERQLYADLYFVLSTQLPRSPRRPSAEDAQTMRVLGYRAICSAALLRFKESAEDGMACLEIRHRLRKVGCVPSGADAHHFNTLVDECVLRALVVGERYEQAERVASGLEEPPIVISCSRGRSAAAPPTAAAAAASTARRPTAFAWQRAMRHIQSFRSAVAAQQWREALAAVEANADSAACVRASPLCAMLAFVHLEAGHPMTSRALLLTYVAELPEPPTWEALSDAPSEHEQLWDSFRSHYVFSTTLLAKASVMSGSAFLNIAAALLQRCLCVLPLYTPARVLGEFVLAFEEQQDALEAAMAKQDCTTALAVSARMLSMPEVTAGLQGEVLLARTQAQWLRGLPLEVVREASQCVAADPECAMAFRLRADALEAMHHVAEAVADRATATRLNPKVELLFAELHTQRRSYAAALQASEAQRRSFTAFASTAPASSSSSSSTHRNGFARGSAETGGGSSSEAAFAEDGRRKTPGASSAFARTATCAEPTHYTVLGVPPHATASEIRHRYRHLTLQCHPDRVVTASEERRQAAAEEFKRVSHAYSILSDAQQRGEYDATLRHLY